ncbi:MAG: hypothetical protein LAP40_23380 [Acidobacteriia bacterium]|nr:hypothetical protein [Terriglobia bacterium]
MNALSIDMDTCLMPWYVVRVKANTESKVAHRLTNRGMPAFLPVVRRLSRRRGEIEIPLFPGYVFAQFDCRAALPVLTCPGVVHILSRGCVAEPVEPAEMYALQCVSRAGCPLEPLPSFTIGQKVRINTGPLADVEGIVLRDNGRPRLIVSVSLLQRSVVAEIDRDWLDRSAEITRRVQAGS